MLYVVSFAILLSTHAINSTDDAAFHPEVQRRFELILSLPIKTTKMYPPGSECVQRNATSTYMPVSQRNARPLSSLKTGHTKCPERRFAAIDGLSRGFRGLLLPLLHG